MRTRTAALAIATALLLSMCCAVFAECHDDGCGDHSEGVCAQCSCTCGHAVLGVAVPVALDPVCRRLAPRDTLSITSSISRDIFQPPRV